MVKTTDKIILGVLVLLIIGMSGFMITALASPNIDESKDISAEHITLDEAKQIALKASPGVIMDADLEKKGSAFVYEVEIMSSDALIEIQVDKNTGRVISIETEEDESEELEEKDVPITGNALDKASQAALDFIGEGRVTDSEIGDEEGYYEIEITLDDGDEVDVHLDENFNVLSIEYD